MLNDEDIQRRAEGGGGRTSFRMILVWLVSGMILGAVCVGWFGFSRLETLFVRDFSTPIPRQMPLFRTTQEDITASREKLQGFVEGLDAASAPQAIDLGADDLNILLRTDPVARRLSGQVRVALNGQDFYDDLFSDTDFQYLKGNIFVEITNNRLRVDLSVPLRQLGIHEYGDRYINATGEVAVEIRDGTPRITFDPDTVNGEPPSRFVRNRIREVDVYALLMKDRPIYGQFAHRIEAFKIEENRCRMRLNQVRFDSGEGTTEGRLKEDTIRKRFEEIKDWKESADRIAR